MSPAFSQAFSGELSADSTTKQAHSATQRYLGIDPLAAARRGL